MTTTGKFHTLTLRVFVFVRETETVKKNHISPSVSIPCTKTEKKLPKQERKKVSEKKTKINQKEQNKKNVIFPFFAPTNPRAA